ncbi:MAG: hypothetical protein QM831_30020 [Kofleriaceae bacterium]
MAVISRHWRLIAICAFAVMIAWGFAASTLHVTPRMGLPLDDSYIYLTYAKQFGRAQPFTYFPGGGYSAGSTSVVWPMLLAPFWTLGARGHALVWVSFGMCTLLFACVGLGCYRFASQLGNRVTGGVAVVMALVVGPFAWSALSGMEVAFASALLIAMVLLLAAQPVTGPPSWKLVAVLAATSLSRPEATMIASGVIAVAVIQRVRQRDWKAAARWCVPLIAPLLWITANRVLAGNFFPNTGVVKSHFYLPGFDWVYWRDAVKTQLGQMAYALFWAPESVLIVPRVIALLFVIGAVRIAMWGRRENKRLAAAAVIASPLLLMLAVVSTSGVGGWSFQNMRYIATALPLISLVAACALAPVRWPREWSIGSAVLAIGYAVLAFHPLRDQMWLFAQGAMDTNAQVVTIGNYVHDKLPNANLMFHDAGAIAYYGDGRVYDMLGLVTNDQAGIANNGPGARFEFLESLPPDQRPTHFAYYPGWMGSQDFFGEAVLHTSLRPGLPTGKLKRLVGEADMQVLPAIWDHAHSAERPIDDHTGWNVVDRIDIADMASERAHHWKGGLGRRHFGEPTAKWSMVEREQLEAGLMIDGGRTIRDHGETFTVTIDHDRPTRIVIRSGGQTSYSFHEAITRPVNLKLFAGDKEIGHLDLPPPAGRFQEFVFNVPQRAFHADTIELRTEASAPYRVFHWFVLQPDSKIAR